MDSGMLWFDNDPAADLVTKVQRAAAYYRKKYKHDPNCCFVHPSMLNAQPPKLEKIRLEGRLSILPYHFWLGVDETETTKPT